MSVFASLIGIFLVLLFSNLRFLAPRTRDILDKLRDDTINAIEIPEDKFNFALFMSWYQTCHSLETRRKRFQMWGTATMVSVVIGLFTSACAIALSLFEVIVANGTTQAFKTIVGLALMITVISLIEPCFLVFYRYKHSTSRN